MAARWLGLLLLDTQFPRLPGDAGRADSYPMPVRSRMVAGATPARVVQGCAGDGDDAHLLAPFIAAARALAAEGASAITTSCGFLWRWQAPLQAAVPVPVWTSSLLLLPGLKAPGVLSADADALRPQLAAYPGLPPAGLATDSHLHQVLLHNQPALDAAQAQADVLAATQRLLAAHPQVQTLLLECTNLPPFAAALQAATGRPVEHLLTLVAERWKALS